MRHVPLIVVAGGIAVAGALGIGLPALMNAADPVDYFRGAAHGRHSPTTLHEAGYVPERRWRNELPSAGADSQLVPEIPESGGVPRGTVPVTGEQEATP